MSTPSKPFILLQAYEELTEKEAFCLKEMNLNGVLETQAKKAKLTEELVALRQSDTFSEQDKADFNECLSRLQELEDKNAKLLQGTMKQNREAVKSVVRKSSSNAKIRNAYGSHKSVRNAPKSLSDRA